MQTILRFTVALILWAVLPLKAFPENPPQGLELQLQWEEYDLVSPVGSGAEMIGLHQGVVFAMSAGGKDLELYFREVDQETGRWKKADLSVESAFGEIKPVPTPEGIVFFQKNEQFGGYDRPGLLYWDKDSRLPVWRELEPLPVPLINPVASAAEGRLIVGGKELRAGNKILFYQLPLQAVGKWLELPPLKTSVDLLNLRLFIQSEGENDAVFLFAGKQNDNAGKSAGFYLSPLKPEWKKINMPSYLSGINGGIVLGNVHILLTAGEQAMAYHTITKTWVKVNGFLSPDLSCQLATDQTNLYAWEFDRSGYRLYISHGVSRPSGIRPLDYLVLVVYFLLLLGVGYLFSKGLKNTDDYFRGGKRIPWWAAGLSILVTKLSAITFMSLPAKAYATNWLYFWIPVGNIVLAIIVIKYVLPFFCRLDITSTYEYLEKRFNTTTRVIGSITYMLFELVRMGVLLLLPAIVIAVVTGFDIYLCIILIGVVATVYTMMGGIEAVIWTDVLQAIILIAGAIIALIVVGSKIELENLNTFLQSPLGQEKLKYTDFSIDLTKATFLVIALSWIGKIQDYVSNQTVVQRFISTKDEKSAARSIWAASLLGIPVITLFLVLGTALFLFYEANPGRLDPFMEQPDALLPLFIVNEMPAGVAGLVLAAIFAAAMSSLDSSLNSMSTVIVTDFYKKFGTGISEAKSLRLAKVLTVFLGIFGTGSALFMVGTEISSLYDQLFSVIGLFGGGLTGVFILGIFTRRANTAGTLTGFFASAVILFGVSNYSDLHVFLYALIGMVSCAGIGYLMSFILPSEQHASPAFTIYDLPAKARSSSPEGKNKSGGSY
ncbi:SSS family transporter [Anseongella ginsenosidimutans]|uniref:SSS family transporter n=1 Tax=Anseongella ginsenosidimutans TaxID=496056 RepID=A0A4R3KQU8_9SPHI|nr:sodium:solute symporter [Anseongella ginsenosidimutans]QEC52374.1 sodium/solute symporter [Anseongella ginsenosidimutans]TCS85884.1 SSS family transporter [Anseongella ginsenosidimutans]